MLKHGGLWEEAVEVMRSPASAPGSMSAAMAEVVSQLHKVRTFIKDEQRRFASAAPGKPLLRSCSR